MPSQTLSDRLKKVCSRIDQRRARPLSQPCPYVFMDGVRHQRSRGGAVENVSMLVAIGVGLDGHREVAGAAEGMKEDAVSRQNFVTGLIARGSTGVRLVVGDRRAGLVSTVGEPPPGARCRRRMVHFMRSILSEVPRRHSRRAADALKAIFASETRRAALAKAESVAAEMGQGKLDQAAACLREGIGEAAACLLDDYPRGHRRRIRANNMIGRLNRGIRRRTRVVGAFPDGESALMLITARIRYVTADDWSARRRLDMPRLRDTIQEAN